MPRAATATLPQSVLDCLACPFAAAPENAAFASGFPERQGTEVRVRLRSGPVGRRRLDDVMPDALPALGSEITAAAVWAIVRGLTR